MPYLGQRPSKGDENNFKILDNISSHTLTFDGTDASIVSAANDTITLRNHRFVQGQRVTYNKGSGGTVIPGLSDGVYFIIKDDHNTIKLATTASNASNGVVVNITGVAPGGSSHTLNVAFDGVNTKFKATHTNGVKAKITRSAQLVISINGVIQQPHDTATPSTGFGFDLDGTIVFSQAPAASDEYWAHLLTNNNVTFDISNNDVDNFTGDGSTTTFNLSKTPSDNRNVLVTIDGVVQYPSDSTTTRAYNVVENVLTFTTAPDSNVEIQVRHIGFAGSTSGGSSGGVTSFYGRTGAVVLKNTDNIVANNAEFAGNLTVQGTMTTLDTKVTEVDQLEVAANNTTVGAAITQTGSGQGLLVHADTNYKGILVNGTNAPTVSFATGDNTTPVWKVGLSGNNSNDLAIGTGAGNSNQFRLLGAGGASLLGTLTAEHIGIDGYLYHNGDTNTRVRFLAADTVTVETAGNERFRIDPNGHITVGVGASSLYNTYLTIPRYTVDGDAAKFISLRNDAAPADVTFVKSRSTTYGSYSATQDDDIIMSINSDIDTGSALSFRGTFRSIYDSATGGVHFMWGSGGAPNTTGEKMRLKGDGKLGIGTDNPSTPLHISYDSNNLLTLDNSTASTQKMFFAQNKSTHAQIYATTNSGALTIESDPSDNHGSSFIDFRVDNEEALRIHSTGWQQSHAEYAAVGINTFASWARTGGVIRAEVGYNAVTTDYMYFGTGTNHPLSLRVNNDNALYIKNDAGRSVGIGTDNPDYGLHVYGAGDILVEDSSNGSAHLRMRSSNNGSDVSNWKIKTSSNNYLYIENDTVGGTSQFTIDDSGNVGINQNTPTADLEIVGTAGTITTLFINSATNNASVANESILKFGFNHSGTPDAVGYVKLIETADNIFDGDMLFGVPYNDGSSGSATREAFRIRASGILKAGTTGFNNADIRLQLHNPGGTASQLQFTGTGTGDTTISRGFRVGYNGSGGQLWNFESNYVRIATSNLERLNIDQYGTTQVNSIRQRAFSPNTGSTNGNYWKIGSVTLNGSEGFILTFCGTGGYSAGQQIAGTTKVVARCSNASTLVGYRTGSSIGAQLGIEDVRWKHEGSNVFSIWAKVQHYAQISPFVDFFGGALGGWQPSNTNTGSTSAPGSSNAFSDWEYKQINGVNTIQYTASDTYFLQNIRMANDKGIDFSAETNEGSTSQNALLADYEEGVWTPTNTIGMTLTVNNGAHYIKIGKQVTVWFDVSLTGNPDSAQCASIENLPYVSKSSNTYYGQSNMVWYSNTGDAKRDYDDDNTLIFVNNNSTTIRIWNVTSGHDRVRSWANGRRFRGTVTYIAKN